MGIVPWFSYTWMLKIIERSRVQKNKQAILVPRSATPKMIWLRYINNPTIISHSYQDKYMCIGFKYDIPVY